MAARRGEYSFHVYLCVCVYVEHILTLFLLLKLRVALQFPSRQQQHYNSPVIVVVVVPFAVAHLFNTFTIVLYLSIVHQLAANFWRLCCQAWPPFPLSLTICLHCCQLIYCMRFSFCFRFVCVSFRLFCQ